MLDVVQLVWRLLLYVVYGVVALLVFRAVFTMPQPYATYTALGIVVMATVKDLYDLLAGDSYITRISYKFVEHNPFNLVLLWGIFTGAFPIPYPDLLMIIVTLASFDVVLDGYFDFRHRADAGVMTAQFLLVGLAILALHVTYGFQNTLQFVTQTILTVLQSL